MCGWQLLWADCEPHVTLGKMADQVGQLWSCSLNKTLHCSNALLFCLFRPDDCAGTWIISTCPQLETDAWARIYPQWFCTSLQRMGDAPLYEVWFLLRDSKYWSPSEMNMWSYKYCQKAFCIILCACFCAFMRYYRGQCWTSGCIFTALSQAAFKEPGDTFTAVWSPCSPLFPGTLLLLCSVSLNVSPASLRIC